jgi:hypothetical protein
MNQEIHRKLSALIFAFVRVIMLLILLPRISSYKWEIMEANRWQSICKILRWLLEVKGMNRKKGQLTVWRRVRIPPP